MLNFLASFVLLALVEWLTLPTYFFGIDYTGSGTYTDLTAKLLRADWHLAVVDLYTSPTPQQAMFELSNTDGTLTPRNNTNLKPGKSAQLTCSYVGASALFNNTNTASQYAQSGNSTIFDGMGGVGLSCYVQVNSFYTPQQGIVDNPSSGGVNGLLAQTLYVESSQIKYTVMDGAGALKTCVDPTTPTLGTPYQYIGNTVAGSYAALYRAGSLVASIAQLVGSLSTASGGCLRVGALGNSKGAYRLAGAVDELLVFNRSLTTAEISSLAVGFNNISSGVAESYSFDEGAGIYAAGRTGNALDLTFTGLSNTSSWAAGLRSVQSFSLFFGRITDVTVSPKHGMRTTIVTAVDDWDRINNITYTTSLYSSWKIQSLFCVLMSLTNVNSFSADAGISDSTGYLWYRDYPAIQALNELVQSGAYQMLIDGGGTVNLYGRYAASFATSVGTYAVTAGEDRQMTLSNQTVFNQVKINTVPRAMATGVNTLAVLPQPIPLPSSGGSLGFWLAFMDPLQPSADIPVGSLVTPVASTDFYAATNSDGTGTNLTSNLSLQMTIYAAAAVCSLYNGGTGNGWLNRFQIRGSPLPRSPALGVQFDVSSSQKVFGKLNLTINNAVIQDYTYMSGLTQAIAADRAAGRDQLAHTVNNFFPDVLQNVPGNVISLYDPFTGYSTTWAIRGTNHELDLTAGHSHKVTYDCLAYDSAPWLVLDSPSLGQLDNNRVLGL